MQRHTVYTIPLIPVDQALMVHGPAIVTGASIEKSSVAITFLTDAEMPKVLKRLVVTSRLLLEEPNAHYLCRLGPRLHLYEVTR